MIGTTRSWKSRKIVGKEKEGSVEGEVSDPLGVKSGVEKLLLTSVK